LSSLSPRERSVDSRPQRLAIASIHVSFPKEVPRLTLHRIASRSFSLSGSSTRLTQLGSRATGQDESNLGSGSDLVDEAQNANDSWSSAGVVTLAYIQASRFLLA